MAYNYGIKNRYTPTHLINKAYGWNGVRRNLGDVPSRLMQDNQPLTAQQFEQQFAYEWLNSGESTFGYTNPPFASGAAGRLIPSLQVSNGTPARIQRGFIRRGEVETGRPESKARLYFMYNPEVITRDYVSYLDQTALDPFNTVYQSSNLVAPPSILDFSFSLFFDRGEEAVDPEHPGVFVDYQFFDLVVRNVVPNDPNSTGNTLPDNGVMMVNPREITVVFSQQLTVQGRPLNARVSFVKFTHRMVPTRMQIDLTIRATYLGPLKPQSVYVAEEFKTADTIPLGGALVKTQFTNIEVSVDMATTANGGTTTIPAVGESSQIISNAGNDVRIAALNYAMSHTVPAGPGDTSPNVSKYDEPKRGSKMINDHWDWVDCSSLVYRSYVGIGQAAPLGWAGGINTSGMVTQCKNRHPAFGIFDFKTAVANDLLKPGDILLRDGHTAFFHSRQANSYQYFHAQSHRPGSGYQVGMSTGGLNGANWTYVMRPQPTGTASQVGNVSLIGPPNPYG